jgi:hypothetical protein
MALLLLFLLFIGSCGGAPSRWDLKAVTWNINGSPKFRAFGPKRSYLSTFDVVLLQETCITTEAAAIELEGYIPFHTMARHTGGRPQWGMTSLFRIASFVGGTIRPLPTGADWLQVRLLELHYFSCIYFPLFRQYCVLMGI